MRSSAPTKADVVASFRRTQILTAARDRFAHHGVRDTTVDDIARAARMAKGTVYLYYRSKDDMLRHLLDEDIEALRAATLPVITDGALEARLRRFFETTLEFFDRNREFMEHCRFELSPDVRKKVRVTLGRCFQDQADAWRQALAEAAARGEVAPATADGAAWTIVSLARGMALHRLAGWTPEPAAAAAARAGELVLKGLATR